MEPVGPSLSEILLASMVGVFVLSFGSILIFLTYQRRLVAKDRQQQQTESKHQEKLLRSIIESQEKERNRIAHDLHDEIGALLTTSRIYFNQLSPGRAEEQLQHVSAKMNLLFDEMMNNIRRISHDLRPVILENLGLAEAVDNLREKLTEVGVGFHFNNMSAVSMSKEAEIILYRILQELIGNTLKHAKASTIHLSMDVNNAHFYFHYRDDGIGFTLRHSKNSNGLGMKSIESRLNLLQGSLQIMEPNKGSSFLIQIPIHNLTKS